MKLSRESQTSSLILGNLPFLSGNLVVSSLKSKRVNIGFWDYTNPAPVNGTMITLHHSNDNNSRQTGIRWREPDFPLLHPISRTGLYLPHTNSHPFTIGILSLYIMKTSAVCICPWYTYFHVRRYRPGFSEYRLGDVISREHIIWYRQGWLYPYMGFPVFNLCKQLCFLLPESVIV